MFATVTKQLKRAISVAKSVLAVAGTAGAALDPTLRSFLREGESLDGVEPLMLTLVRWIESDQVGLEEGEAEQRQAQRRLKKLRLRRDDEQEPLYALLLRIRGIFEDAFGQGTATVHLGLEPRMSKLEPIELRRLAQQTVTILADTSLTLPEPKVRGLWAAPSQYAEQIAELLTPFQTSLDEIESQKREVEKAQKEKTDRLDEVGDRLTWSIRLFEAIYRLADLGFHAERLRLTMSSRPSTGEETEASSEDEESLVADEEPVESAEALAAAVDG